MTVGELVADGERRLAQAGVDSPRLDAQLLAGFVLGWERSRVLTHLGDEFEGDLGEWESVLGRREGREPLAYILGWREFFGRRFLVRPGVLIPRQDTEVLVEAVLERFSEPGLRVLDWGTGSGCIAATLKLERPAWEVMGVDVSAEALGVARENGEALGAEVEWRLSDGVPAGVEVDLLVSNPPYITPGTELMPEVGRFEPEGALFAEEEGLACYRRLALEGRGAGARAVWVEIGMGMEEGVSGMFGEAGWREVFRREDLGGIVRVLGFERLG